MSGCRSAVSAAFAALLLAAACTSGAGDPAPRVQGAACVKACDETMDACSVECSNKVDDLLCSQACIDKHEACNKSCG